VIETASTASSGGRPGGYGGSGRPLLSVVIPLYNEEGGLARLVQRLTPILDSLDMDVEVVFVDDGSRDTTAQLAREQANADSRFKLVQLSRNFGHQAAISAGMDYASGDAVVVMDGDLQDPPEEIPKFVAKWRDGYQVVYAIRRSRQEIWPKRAAYWLFYRMLRRISKIEVPPDSGDFGLIDREVAQLLRQMPERNRFLRGLRSWVGLRQTGVEVDREARAAGESKYTLAKLVGLAMDGFISFSYAPLQLATRTGFVVSAVGFLFGAWLIVLRLGWGIEVPGWTSLMVVVVFLGGVQLITTGILGEYIGRIYDEVKRRPLYIVSGTTNLDLRPGRADGDARATAERVERRL
jgi:polyisoprenyl-phosphate glycosyltransferase